jgi:hypothetical protein
MEYFFKRSELDAFIEASQNISFVSIPEVSVNDESIAAEQTMRDAYSKLVGLLVWLKENNLYEMD